MKCSCRMASSAAIIGLLVLAGWNPPARAGTLTYDVIVDSTGIEGTSGYLEFAMNAQTFNGDVTATITNFTTDGALGAVSPPIGSVSGSLSSPPLSLVNDQFSDFQQAFTYGTFASFLLTFTGTDVGNPGAMSGTTLAILLEDGTGMPYNTGPAGEAADFYFPPILGAQYQLFSPSSAGGPLITLGGQSVPEPSSLVLMGLGIGAVVAVGRRRRKARAA